MTSADPAVIDKAIEALDQARSALVALRGGDSVEDAAADGTVWITVDQAAGIAGISPRQMWRWIEQGRVRSEITPSGRRRVDKASVLPSPTECRKMS